MHFEWFVNLYNRACWLVSKYNYTYMNHAYLTCTYLLYQVTRVV